MAFSKLNIVFRLGASRLPTSLNLVSISRNFASAATANYENLLIEKKGEKQNIGLITLNRPKSLNALCDALINELMDALKVMNSDDSVAAVVITGSGKAFAAGADIKEMSNKDYAGTLRSGFLADFNLYSCKKPVIAAVHGYALGGGCELAMMCDVIYAGDKTKFGQPEINIGTIPGAGGTQRIARSCGKSKAMEICLTGDHFTSQEAERIGLISKVVPEDKVVEESVKLAERMARHSPVILQLCKEAVNVAFETSLQEGLRYERGSFYSTFATEDRKEGMTAFVEKRKPAFKGK